MWNTNTTCGIQYILTQYVLPTFIAWDKLSNNLPPPTSQYKSYAFSRLVLYKELWSRMFLTLILFLCSVSFSILEHTEYTSKDWLTFPPTILSSGDRPVYL